MGGLGEIIDSNYQEYAEFMYSLQAPAAHCLGFLERGYWDDTRINHISHRADADGLASFLSIDIGLQILKSYMGLDGSPEINSTRVMDFSDDGESLENSVNLARVMGEGLYIVADVATFDDSARKIFSDVINIDHHQSTAGLDLKFNINPHNHGIDGDKEISGSIGSYLFINQLFEEICKDNAFSDQKIVSNTRKVQDMLDYLGIVALAGADADMQGPNGLNKAIYDYLEKKNVISYVDCPFYGYSTKPLYKVLSESSIPFNLKYGARGDVPDDFHFTDDIKTGRERDGLAKQLLRKQGFTNISDPLLAHSPEKRDKIRALFEENLTKYCDPEIRQGNLEALSQGQYIVNKNKYLFGNYSISEVANMLTALSKFDYGDDIHTALQTYLLTESKDKDTILETLKNKINSAHIEYKRNLSSGMKICEGLMSTGLRRFPGEMFYLSLDGLKQETGEDRLRRLTGVYGGIITKNRLLPGDYGVLFTSCNTKYGQKVSARMSDHHKYNGIHLGKLMRKFGGGGHKGAASCYLKGSQQEFFDVAKEYLSGVVK